MYSVPFFHFCERSEGSAGDASKLTHQRCKPALGEGDDGEIGHGPDLRPSLGRCCEGVCGRGRGLATGSHPRPLPTLKIVASPLCPCEVGGAYILLSNAVTARTPCRRPVVSVFGPLRLLGRERRGVPRRRGARVCGAVPGARREAKGDSPAHGWASPHGHFLAAHGRHRARPNASRSGARALQTCRTSS